MLQKLLVNQFEWIEETSQFNKDFVKNYNEENNEGYVFEVDVQYSILQYFYQKERKFKKLKSLLLII